jgi:hypothetical protein
LYHTVLCYTVLWQAGCFSDHSGATWSRCDETGADARSAKSIARELESRLEGGDLGTQLATLAKNTTDTAHHLDLHVKKHVRASYLRLAIARVWAVRQERAAWRSLMCEPGAAVVLRSACTPAAVTLEQFPHALTRRGRRHHRI